MADEYSTLVSNLDKAAEIVLNPLTNVSADERRAAENYFLELRKLKSPYAICKNVLETSSNHFVLYQIASVIGEVVLREWFLLNSTDIENIWQYLLDFVCHRPNLPNYVTGEILMTVFTIVKRGTFDGKSGHTDKIFDTAAKMIASNDVNYLSLACQMLSSFCTEYCTCWRSSTVGITWDFHIRAKRHFENTDLKRILELVLQVLQHVSSFEESSNSSSLMFTNPNVVILMGRILNVAEIVLNWNFGSKYLPKRLTYSVEFSPAVSFHPPDTWRPILLNPEALKIFFQLHSKVRTNGQLSHQSLQCLIQLASLSGTIFPDDERTREEYLEYFVTSFIKLFESEPSPSEVVDFAHIVQKLFCFHSISRLSPSVLLQFLSLVTRNTCIFCHKATNESLNESDDTVYQEAYCKMLDGWAVQLKAGNRSCDESAYYNSAVEIFDCYWRCHLSPPTGTRPQTVESECDETVEEDRLKYFDVLVNVGIVGRYALERNLTQLSCLLNDRITGYQLMVQQSTNVYDESKFLATLQHLQEDIHWLLLVCGFVLASEDIENVYLVPLDVLHYSAKVYNEKKVDISSSQSYLASCITLSNVVVNLDQVDDVVKLVGCVFRWTAFELRLLTTNNVHLLSPQVAQSTVWCLRRLLCAFSEADEGLASALPCMARIALQSGSDISPSLIHFVLENFFGILFYWHNETQLTKEIVLLLICFVETENRAEEVGKEHFLLSQLGKIQVHQLSPSTRKGLVRALVKIGACSESSEIHQRMYGMILEPMYKRYERILSSNSFGKEASSAVYSDLLDLLDCFSGVAKAVQNHSAKILFDYLAPVLDSCSGLLSSCKNNQPVVDAVLQLFVDISQKMVMYLKEDTDAERVYRDLLTMLKTYSDNNIVKYVNLTNVDEEKTSDLVLVLHILTNLLSKDVCASVGLENSSNNAVSAATVTLLGLEMLMPLMNKDLLSYPNVCVQYFKLITFASELYAEKVCNMVDHMKHNVLESVKLGLSFEFGIDIVKLSLDLLNALATYVSQRQMEITLSELKHNLASFIPTVFEICLKASSDVELLNDSSVTLFSLICCDQANYRKYMENIVSSQKEEAVKQKLTTAFDCLLPSELNVNILPQQMLRKEKRAFRDRFEIFLNDIQGLLCL